MLDTARRTGFVKAVDAMPDEIARFWRTDDGRTAGERAAAYGIDHSLLDDNLRLTPAERLRQNDAILSEADALRAAYLATHARPDPHHVTPR